VLTAITVAATKFELVAGEDHGDTGFGDMSTRPTATGWSALVAAVK
jgi:hypothetical protein